MKNLLVRTKFYWCWAGEPGAHRLIVRTVKIFFEIEYDFSNSCIVPRHF